jgi:hypothetical protein
MIKIISACGDICSECPRYIATKNNDNNKLQKLAELWFRLGFRDRIVNAEELKCDGCKKDKFCSHNINNCEKIRNITNCGECDDFPCEKINLVFEKNEKQKLNCLQKCTKPEYEQLSKAFLMKKEVLTRISLERKKQLLKRIYLGSHNKIIL